MQARHGLDATIIIFNHQHEESDTGLLNSIQRQMMTQISNVVASF